MYLNPNMKIAMQYFWYNTITNTINTNILYILHENYKKLQEARRLAIVKEAKISLAARRIQAEWRMHVEYKKFWTIKSFLSF